MSAVPPSPLALLATGLGCVTAALGGCGASEPESVGAEALQSRLVSVADRVDACFAKTNDARKCTDASALAADDLVLGDGVGEVDVQATKPLRYQLVAKADQRGTEFAILVQPIGARKRVCKPAGTAPCPKGGVW